MAKSFVKDIAEYDSNKVVKFIESFNEFKVG
jgi:hypothetical protein